MGRVRVFVGEGLECRGGHQVAVLHQGGDLSVPGHTYIKQSINFFVMTNMNFTIASNLDNRLFWYRLGLDQMEYDTMYDVRCTMYDT